MNERTARVVGVNLIARLDCGCIVEFTGNEAVKCGCGRTFRIGPWKYYQRTADTFGILDIVEIPFPGGVIR